MFLSYFPTKFWLVVGGEEPMIIKILVSRSASSLLLAKNDINNEPTQFVTKTTFSSFLLFNYLAGGLRSEGWP